MRKNYSIETLPFKTSKYTILHHFYTNNEHTHQYWELAYQISGESINRLNDKTIVLKAGDCIIMRPGDVHSINSVVAGSSHRDHYISDEKMKKILSIFHESFHQRFLNDTTPIIIHLGIHAVIELEDAAIIFKMQSEPSNLLDDIQTSIISYILGKYERAACLTTTGVPTWINQLIRLVSSPECFSLKIEEIAQILKYSSGHITREFQRYMHMPLKKYIITQKLEYAERLLVETNESVSNIALKCGFNSVNGFINTFTKQTGTSPNKYRKANIAEVSSPV